MRPTRLATMTLAGGLLLSSAGCFNLFDRFQAWRNGGESECACMDAGGAYGAMPTSVQAPTGGPVLVQPDQIFTPPPPTTIMPQATIPQGPPPRIVPIPAQPMPWTGQH